MSRLRIVDKSSRHDAGALAALVAAVDNQLRDVAVAWGEDVWTIVDAARGVGFEVVLLDNAEVAGALGYHDVGPDGNPYARVFVEPIFDHGGAWLEGPTSVSVTVSHEVCELLGDPGANRWAADSDGALWALELCDAVEQLTYADGATGVSLSDFLYPSYFNSFGLRPFDHLDRLAKPFEIAAGGYSIGISGHATPTQVFGASYPEWRKETKRAPGSRTRVRLGAIRARRVP